MNWLFRFLLLLALPTLPAISRLHAQEAMEIHGDQDSSTTPPAEGPTETDAEATPKPKKKAKGSAENVQEMSPEEFKRMGLDKLSPAELQTLNEWLKGYKHQAESKAAAEATEQGREEGKQQGREEARAEAKKEFNRNWLSTDKIFSRIDGEFYGLKKYTHKAIIHLEDGSTWKQANDYDNLEAKLTDHPPVMVTHSFAGYKMHVIGAGEFWVNPVRSK